MVKSQLKDLTLWSQATGPHKTKLLFFVVKNNISHRSTKPRILSLYKTSKTGHDSFAGSDVDWDARIFITPQSILLLCTSLVKNRIENISAVKFPLLPLFNSRRAVAS